MSEQDGVSANGAAAMTERAAVTAVAERPAVTPGLTDAGIPAHGWLLLVYRVPSEPSNNRVSVWRELKRMGALYLQQCVCILPAFPRSEQGIEAVKRRIESLGGTHMVFRVPHAEETEAQHLVDGFRQLSAKEYDEIIEECQTKFAKEVEFERFRKNFTYEEAEEIREDLEKIRRWYGRVVQRDWFDAGKREDVEAELAKCERLLEDFEEEVYHHAGEDQSVVRRTEAGPK
jgi:hypothetical protein